MNHPMNTNMAGFRCFSKIFVFLCFGQSSLSIGRVNPILSRVGMGIVENSTVRFGSRFCFYSSVLSRFPKQFINDISWIRNYAMECVAELA